MALRDEIEGPLSDCEALDEICHKAVSLIDAAAWLVQEAEFDVEGTIGPDVSYVTNFLDCCRAVAPLSTHYYRAWKLLRNANEFPAEFAGQVGEAFFEVAISVAMTVLWRLYGGCEGIREDEADLRDEQFDGVSMLRSVAAGWTREILIRDVNVIANISLEHWGDVQYNLRRVRRFDAVLLIGHIRKECSRAKAAASAPDARPAPNPRLVVALDPAQATWDGQAFALTPDQAAFIRALLDADGNWMSGREFPDIPRPDRVRRSLPEPLRELIESGSARGFRIRRASLA